MSGTPGRLTCKVAPKRRSATEIEFHQAMRSLIDGPMRLPAGRRPWLRQLEAATAAHEAHGEASTLLDILRRRMEDSGLVPMWALVRDAIDADHRTYTHVLVDEAQDATPLETKFARQLAGDGTNFAVGDERQAIFGSRSARHGFGDLPRMDLALSFRFGPAIAEYASSLVGPPSKGTRRSRASSSTRTPSHPRRSANPRAR